MLPIEIELGMPSRCIFIATTICHRRSQPRPSRADGLYTSRLGPIHQPMPHPASCEAKLGRDDSILARQQGSAVAEGPADPLRQAMLYHRGSRQPALACWLAGWLDGMGDQHPHVGCHDPPPCSLKKPCQAGTTARCGTRHREARQENTRAVEQTAAEPSPGSGKAGVDLCSAAKLQSHDGHTMPCWKMFLALGKCA